MSGLLDVPLGPQKTVVKNDLGTYNAQFKLPDIFRIRGSSSNKFTGEKGHCSSGYMQPLILNFKMVLKVQKILKQIVQNSILDVKVSTRKRLCSEQQKKDKIMDQENKQYISKLVRNLSFYSVKYRKNQLNYAHLSYISLLTCKYIFIFF